MYIYILYVYIYIIFQYDFKQTFQTSRYFQHFSWAQDSWHQVTLLTVQDPCYVEQVRSFLLNH